MTQSNKKILEGISQQDLAELLFDRLIRRYPDIITTHGHETVGDAVLNVADIYQGAEELGSSDINIMLKSIINHLEREPIDEITQSSILEGIYKHINEGDLRQWFKEKWVRFNPQGKIMGPCARGSESEGKPKCLPQAKAHALGKKGRKYAAAKKRREDPNPERRGPAKNVATKKKTNEDLSDALYWTHLSDTLTIEEKLTIFEEYYTSKTIINESNDAEVTDYFSKLTSLSEIPTKNKKYLLTFLGLMNNKVVKLQAPEQVIVLSKEGNVYKIQSTDGRISEFPEKIISNKLTTISLFFSNNVAYDKLRSILSLKFDFDGLEDFDSYIKKKTNEAESSEDKIKKLKDYISKKERVLSGGNSLSTQERKFLVQARKELKQLMSIKKEVTEELCPHCGGEMVSEELMNEKKDACYYKVKSRYKVWPSAYASGALVKCRKKGAKNWGTKSESAILKGIQREVQEPMQKENEVSYYGLYTADKNEPLFKYSDLESLKNAYNQLREKNPNTEFVAKKITTTTSVIGHPLLLENDLDREVEIYKDRLNKIQKLTGREYTIAYDELVDSMPIAHNEYVKRQNAEMWRGMTGYDRDPLSARSKVDENKKDKKTKESAIMKGLQNEDKKD